MFSFGIRFGEGFDKYTIKNIMDVISPDYDFDYLVVGTNPGGVASVLEGIPTGKKMAIIKWNQQSRDEKRGFEENLEEMAVNLKLIPRVPSIQPKTKDRVSVNINPSVLPYFRLRGSQSSGGPSVSKVRKSKLDLNNELFKRGQKGRKLLQNTMLLEEKITEARSSGWRISAVLEPLSMNWNKMMNKLMDYQMEENWKLMSTLSEGGVEIIEGWPEFIDKNTIKISQRNSGERIVTAHVICIAPAAVPILPEHVIGAEDYGITVNDFLRLNEPPGKTLIIGDGPDALECAGIIACYRLPVTIMSQFKILKDFDSEISQMIIEDLKKRGVSFIDDATLNEIELAPHNRLTAKYTFRRKPLGRGPISRHQKDEYDTIIFAIGSKTSIDFLNVTAVDIEYDDVRKRLKISDNNETSVPNIYSVADVTDQWPGGFEVTEQLGRLLGRRLFAGAHEVFDYTIIPYVIYTPIEYAFVGSSENLAVRRMGDDCIDIYHGSFRPVELVSVPNRIDCFVKIILYKPKDLIIGIHLLGPQAGEVIQGFAATLKQGLTLTQLQSLVAVHGTKAQEILKIKQKRKSRELNFVDY